MMFENMKGVLAALITLVAFAGSALAQEYDVVILNGRVMDHSVEFRCSAKCRH